MVRKACRDRRETLHVIARTGQKALPKLLQLEQPLAVLVITPAVAVPYTVEKLDEFGNA